MTLAARAKCVLDWAIFHALLWPGRGGECLEPRRMAQIVYFTSCAAGSEREPRNGRGLSPHAPTTPLTNDPGVVRATQGLTAGDACDGNAV